MAIFAENMTNEYQIRVVPEVAAQEDRLKAYLADEQSIDVRTIYGVRVLKRSIDARQRQIYVNLKVRVYVNEQPTDDEYVRTEYPNVEGRLSVFDSGVEENIKVDYKWHCVTFKLGFRF